MISVFYDGKCGICRREIAHYKRVAPPERFNWVDITNTAEPFTNQGCTVADGLKILHAMDDQGNMRTGMGAFTLIWRQLPNWRWLAAVVNLAFVLPLAESAYRKFAEWRFKRLGYLGCEL